MLWRYVFAPPVAPPGIAEFSGQSLGTTWLVKVDHDLLEAQRTEVRVAIEGALDLVDSLMSTWRDDSELTALNAAPANEPFRVAAETFDVLSVSQAVSEATDGAFDVTVRPLVSAWGFGSGASAPEPPTEEVLAAARARVGFRNVQLDPEASTVTKARDDLTIDLSAAAKGFAVDEVARAVEALGFGRYLVEVGGELRAGEAKEDGEPWRVAIETPDARTRSIFGVLEMTREAVATSGDYRDFYEVDGVRYAHLIDPRTGRPVGHAGASVTVIESNTTAADAWATALSVLGPVEGYDIAEASGLTAFFIWQGENGFESRATSSMEARVSNLASRN